MKREDRERYLEQYTESKKRGIPFFPDALFKDAVASVIVLIALIALSWFVGSELSDRADPSEDYSPKPEWYFLFLFQLLKYFPGDLEWLGVIVIPGVVVLLLAALPWLDRSGKRHITGRPLVLGFSAFMLIGAVGLSIQSIVEQPVPTEVATGDPVAALYVENCSGCHGPSIDVPEGTELTAIIAGGGHEGMPAWSADLSTDEIDALAGFILSPNGSVVFGTSCSECHAAADLSAIDPLTLQSALQDEGFEPHAGLELAPPTGAEATALVNFLIAPDGQRLFALNCASCHGNAVTLAGSEADLRETIETGGGHLDMPAMAGVISDAEIDLLAAYVVDPASGDAAAVSLFSQQCSVCHGTLVPTAPDVDTAGTVIRTGGAHEEMPVWGEVLTIEQIDALTAYAFAAAQGSPAVVGAQLFADNCAFCHGDFGEGGINPANPDLIISPISTAEYLYTRDDTTLRAIVNRGQPDLGMSPFGLAFGGPLDEEEVGAIVAFIRAWQTDPPVELPPEIQRAPLLPSADQVYAQFCSQCHGATGEGGIGPEFQSDEFHATKTDDQLVESIDSGHRATAMIAWGQVLTAEQIEELVAYIRSLRGGGDGAPPPDATEVSFGEDVLPILEQRCSACHGEAGGWSVDSYEAVMSSGASGPEVVPGDPDGSILGQRILGTVGALMPPQGMPDEEVDIIIAWIAAGALDD